MCHGRPVTALLWETANPASATHPDFSLGSSLRGNGRLAVGGATRRTVFPRSPTPNKPFFDFSMCRFGISVLSRSHYCKEIDPRKFLLYPILRNSHLAVSMPGPSFKMRFAQKSCAPGDLSLPDRIDNGSGKICITKHPALYRMSRSLI